VKGFVIAAVLLAVIVTTVFAVTFVADGMIKDLYASVEDAGSIAEIKSVKRDFDRIYPFLCSCTTDNLIAGVERAFAECGSGNYLSEEEKCRLLLAIDELRRQAGLSIFGII